MESKVYTGDLEVSPGQDSRVSGLRNFCEHLRKQ